jgi:hypothetical protein
MYGFVRDLYICVLDLQIYMEHYGILVIFACRSGPADRQHQALGTANPGYWPQKRTVPVSSDVICLKSKV